GNDILDPTAYVPAVRNMYAGRVGSDESGRRREGEARMHSAHRPPAGAIEQPVPPRDTEPSTNRPGRASANLAGRGQRVRCDAGRPGGLVAVEGAVGTRLDSNH